ncbi:sulfonate transport system substrate-binding protein [Rhodoligotrophos appendicifer]|uniref:aliphatic sulfonate ABC transporter substrate-binding protein n=1 Tax=Rhodoligotrophos appendicifer TaxID=987056 RepID=UPI001186CC0A|nr:aliphatic sulfonate ABC transporter substrate-binding protein [Rhodoligotrophos appendicifer]
MIGLVRRWVLASALALSLLPTSLAMAEEKLSDLNIDWATYNPVSIVLKDQGLLEKEFAADGTTINWVQSAGSNKALEFLNAGSLDFGSSAGAAALIARINGNPVKAIYVYSQPEWTALVTSKDSSIKSVADLKGKSVAVTRGTDPHIFLVRALADAGLTDKDVRFVLLQHADGRAALIRGDVDAWAGLDPMMASAELQDGARLFYRKAEANTWGVLDVREEFAAQHPEAVARVLKVYEEGRKWALANPDKVAELLSKAARIPLPVAQKQLQERTKLTYNKIGAEQRDSILAAGKALQQAGVIAADVDVTAQVDALIDDTFSRDLTN